MGGGGRSLHSGDSTPYSKRSSPSSGFFSSASSTTASSDRTEGPCQRYVQECRFEPTFPPSPQSLAPTRMQHQPYQPLQWAVSPAPSYSESSCGASEDELTHTPDVAMLPTVCAVATRKVYPRAPTKPHAQPAKLRKLPVEPTPPPPYWDSTPFARPDDAEQHVTPPGPIVLRQSSFSSNEGHRSGTSTPGRAVQPPTPSVPPAQALHRTLEGSVSFHAYPTQPFQLPPTQLRRVDMVRVFIGQLPYGITDMQIQWLCYTFGNGAAVYFPERIYQTVYPQQQPSFPPSPFAPSPTVVMKGCAHVYCEERHVAGLFAGLHDRLLIDDPGVWYASDSHQFNALRRHCEWLRSHPSHRPHRMPYAAVTAQYAKLQPTEAPVPQPIVTEAPLPSYAPGQPQSPSYLQGKRTPEKKHQS